MVEEVVQEVANDPSQGCNVLLISEVKCSWYVERPKLRLQISSSTLVEKGLRAASSVEEAEFLGKGERDR